MSELRTYGVQTTIRFELYALNGVDLNTTPAAHDATGATDTRISKDGGAFAATTNAFTHVGEGIYAIVLTAAEMQAAHIALKVRDISGTQVWLTRVLHIYTKGHASSMFPDSAVTIDLTTTYEGTHTLAGFFRLGASALWGKVSGAGGTSPVFRDQDDTKNRISATVDSDGNRTALTKDET